MDTNSRLIDFIARSPSCFHAAAAIAARLESCGFCALSEAEEWKIRGGGKYYVTRNQSSVIAFAVPRETPNGFMMCASHSDSPTFKLKEHAEAESAGMYVRLNTERYGGMLCSTWLDRPLSVAGRLVVRDGTRILSRLVDVPRDLLLIPNVAIHMMRNANDSMSYNANVDMFPLLGSTDAKDSLRAILADAAGVQAEDILSADLYLYNRMRGTVWGAKEEFVSAPRLDDLQCAFASTEGFASAEPCGAVSVLAVLDNEEVGSQTKQGAASTFLSDVLARICEALGMDRRRAVAASFLVSADNAHAVHPNHPEFADANHRPRMNGGIVIKHNANQRYTTDAVSQAIFASVCAAADVPVQYFANRSDMPGGSTLGNISNTHVSLNTVDIGLAQLAMHSSYETAGAADTDYMIAAMRKLYSSALRMNADGEYELI
ncbi:MAG: M18 family aminopeptidase [Eubacteriales bacterium]